ncbi:hypothetical protein RAD15_29165 [Bradyrhizobium sp. 14AA]
MTARKTLVLAGLLLIAFPLRQGELLSRVAAECKCDQSELGCRIMCSGIGSGQGTGGGTSSFNSAPGVNRLPADRPVVVPRTDTDIRSKSEQIK